jgi:hypothetical protein
MARQAAVRRGIDRRIPIRGTGRSACAVERRG